MTTTPGTGILIRVYLFLCILGIGLTSSAQMPTMGLLHSGSSVSDGYTLFSPERNNNVYLIDNCGEVINDWTFSENPGITCYLLEDGTLLRAGKDSLALRDWDNARLWSYAMTANGLAQHHDIEPLPNGNILCVLNDLYTSAEIIAEGRDPALVSGNFKLDRLIELHPIGLDSAEIVWEWKFIDHLIQDFDSTKLNFGIVANQPELIDLNYVNISNTDWTHLNSIDYNATLDQIIISARHMSEIYILDHSTTTAEAAGHSGGNTNMGGDILWRWGNPEVYKQGGPQDHKLFLQHDAQWVEQGYLDEGKISVFNNGGDGTATFSSIHLITPEIDNGTYLKQTGKFIPLDFEWTWSGSILGTPVYSDKKSGTHALSNGNFIICETFQGQVSEITKGGDHLWTYKNPTGQSSYMQFDNILFSDNMIFRAEKYPSNYPGFMGMDLSQKGIIEDMNPISDTCTIIPPLVIYEQRQEGVDIVNPVKDGRIIFNRYVNLDVITIYDIRGQILYKKTNFSGVGLEIKLVPAMYFLRIVTKDKIKDYKIIVQ